MDKSKVNIEELLETLKRNREAHQAEFTEAVKNFKLRAASALSRRAEVLENDDFDFAQFTLSFNLPKPQEFTGDFDRAIAQLEWAQRAGESTVLLDQRDFDRFVLNRWEWAQAFASSTSLYNG